MELARAKGVVPCARNAAMAALRPTGLAPNSLAPYVSVYYMVVQVSYQEREHVEDGVERVLIFYIMLLR